jgi:hypothetical protein
MRNIFIYKTPALEAQTRMQKRNDQDAVFVGRATTSAFTFDGLDMKCAREPTQIGRATRVRTNTWGSNARSAPVYLFFTGFGRV